MKKMFKFLTAAAVCAAATSMAAPQYPFKSYTYPHGNVVQYGDDAMIKDHFAKWKKAWMKDVNGETWILAPEGDCSTVSEAIAYGMLIMVYMDDGTNGAEQDFAKLYKTWSNHGGGNGMDWRINNGNCPDQQAGTGSASDADFDAALALAMAGKQWNNATYTSAASSLAGWIASNDINGSQIKPGSAWNDGFNPSYATTANFRVFKAIGASGNWDGIASQAYTDLKACQNKSTGLVPDWCDWNSHQAMRTSASVQQANEPLGLYDDAARTYWRTAWDYYWYGTADAKSFNATLTKWLYTETSGMASAIIGGYELNGNKVSTREDFASSTFSGGLGLAAASDETDAGQKFISSTYNYLASKTSCASATGCGETVTGEKYYPSTLNLLYLLLMTGHMPNFLDMNGFTEFTPDPSKAPGLNSSDGEQMALRDSTVGVSGFWNWGAYHDKYDIGTKMSVDSGASPLFYKAALDQVVAEVSMTLGQEPVWGTPEADANRYPSAGIAMSFLSDDNKGVDFSALGVKSIRVTAKVSGPVRMAILSEANTVAGAEPGIVLKATSDYTAQTFDLTPSENGCKGFDPDGSTFGGLLSWVINGDAFNQVPTGTQIIKTVKGFKFEVKGSGDIGDISISKIEFLDASDAVIDPVTITGMAGVGTKPANAGPVAGSSSSGTIIPGGSSSSGAIIADGSSSGMAIRTKLVASFNARVHGMQVELSNASVGSDFTVFSMQGKVITSGKIMNATQTVTLPNKGAYLVRVGSEMLNVIVK